jgi:hypothetical protein
MNKGRVKKIISVEDAAVLSASTKDQSFGSED